MASSPADPPDKLVVDSIHGDIHLTAQEWEIVDTSSFQRLRRLKQLAMGQCSYPNATHTRFAHSLGVLQIMHRVLDVARGQKVGLTPRQESNLRLAALLHDVGHYPYSHLMEKVGNVQLTEEFVEDGGDLKRPFVASGPYPDHEAVGAAIVTEQEDLRSAIGGRRRAKAVAALFTRSQAADAQLSKLIHSSLDMDRLDFLLRDARATGVPYGEIDLNYLLNSLKVSPKGMLGVTKKALPAAEHFLLARFFMYQTVYYHKTTYALEECCRQLLRRVRDERKYGIPCDGRGVIELVSSPELGTFTDAMVDRIVQEAATNGEEGVTRTLAQAIRDRRPPKLLKEVRVLTADPAAHHAGAMFRKDCRRDLRRLAEEFEIPLGRLLFCETPPLGLEQRGAMVAVSDARDLPEEEDEELIKVFVDNDPEPKALVEVEHSLIKLCASHVLLVLRLYYVRDPADESDLVERMRKRVAGWGEP